jgi:peptide/nickel transport system substrate-binding protein
MKTTNQEERKEYYLNVAKQINEDVPMIFLYAQDREIMCNPKLENFDPYTFNIFCDIWEWDFAQ